MPFGATTQCTAHRQRGLRRLGDCHGQRGVAGSGRVPACRPSRHGLPCHFASQLEVLPSYRRCSKPPPTCSNSTSRGKGRSARQATIGFFRCSAPARATGPSSWSSWPVAYEPVAAVWRRCDCHCHQRCNDGAGSGDREPLCSRCAVGDDGATRRVPYPGAGHFVQIRTDGPQEVVFRSRSSDGFDARPSLCRIADRCVGSVLCRAFGQWRCAEAGPPMEKLPA